MDELEDMINTTPLIISKSIDQRIQRLLRKILKKNSWERISCDGILNDSDFVSILNQCNIKLPENNKKNMNYYRFQILFLLIIRSQSTSEILKKNLNFKKKKNTKKSQLSQKCKLKI